MMELKRLNEILPSGSFDGFLASMTDAPWATGEHAASDDDVDRLDMLYLFDHSGEKYVVPLMKMFLDEDTEKLTQLSLTEAANMALALWRKKWTALWEVANAEYNPIENYNMTENEKVTPTGSETETDAMTGTDTTRTQGTAANNETANSVYGFNSTDPVPAAVTSQKSDFSAGTTFGHTNTRTKTFTQRQTERELTRAGNIGVQTTQDMLMKSIELARWNFWLQVFEDLDATFCLDCY